MKTPIAKLLERASVALPPQKPSRSSWAPLYPVVQTLMVNGHTIVSSVEWLIEQEEIKPSERTKAYRALQTMHGRKNPKTKED